MNSQPEEEVQRKMNSSSAKFLQPEKQTHTTESAFAKLHLYLERFVTWFNSLSRTKKLVVTGVGVLWGFVILQTVFKLVASLISLALLAVLVYLGYKFFISNSFQGKE